MTQTPNLPASTRARRSPAVTARTPGKLLGNWQLQQVLGQGTYATVYEARPLGCPPSWPADYAVKMLRHEHASNVAAVDAMHRESEVGRGCSHPNLIPILESHVDASPSHLVMPRIAGATAEAVIRRVGQIRVTQTLWLARQIAQALRHLHENGWIHGDVKPANILISRQGHATLIDLAFCMNATESLYSTERPLKGSLAYVAPEMLTSRNTTQPASDFYSLGATMFHMISGSVPFPQQDSAMLVEAHLRAIPPNLTHLDVDIPKPVSDLVSRLLAKNPMRRPQTADELIDLLTELEIESLESRVSAA